jgi:CubicO group peptidase (beta-lactamase class C family)
MIRSPDWVSYTLKQPLMADPGAGMVYNSGCSQLLAAILQHAAKMDVAVFARTRLFEPLGITAFQWERDPQGMPIGGFGLYLTPRDMARFGQLYLQRGMWAGRRLISGEWVDRTTYPLHRTYEIGFYGRHWWVSSFHANRSEDDAEEWYYFALGFGGQYITVLPSRQTVVVLCNDRHKRDREYVDYLRHFIIPALCGT